MAINEELNQLKLMLGISDKIIPTTFENVEDTQKKVEELATNNISEETKSTIIKDSYGNSLTAVGTDDKVKSFTSYGYSNDTLNWSLWSSLYNDSWVFRRAIDKPSHDMVKSGITLRVDKEENLKELDNVYKDINNQTKKLIELVQWGRLFGGAIAVVMFDSLKDEDYKLPLNINKIKASKTMKLYVTDRWYGCSPSAETVSDMTNIDFGLPKTYDVTFADGHSFRVHHDYVLRFEGRTAPMLIKTGWLQNWGYAEGAHIINELARDDQLKASITSLVNKSLLEVVKMSGMRGVFMGTTGNDNTQLTKRLEMVNWARNYNSITFLDKDDDYEQFQASITGLSDLLATNMKLVSSALNMQGILFGDLSDGFSKDSDAYERYDDEINSLCENYYRMSIEKLVWILYKKYDVNENIDLSFNSLVASKLTKDKVEAIQRFQQLLSGMLQDGVITLKQYALALKDYSEKKVINFNLTDEDIEKLDDKMDEEMENIDLENEKKPQFR